MGENTEYNFRAEVIFADREAFFQPIHKRSSETALLILLAMIAAAASAGSPPGAPSSGSGNWPP